MAAIGNEERPTETGRIVTANRAEMVPGASVGGEAQRLMQLQSQLLQAIVTAQVDFIAGRDPAVVFDALLSTMLAATGSEYGFIGEQETGPSGTPRLRTIAITDIAWDEQSQRLYQARFSESGLIFANLDSLFGAVLRTAQPVISNAPDLDPRRAGLPPGHPALEAFLGLPFFSGSEMIGMIGLANRPGGYDMAVAELLGPLLATAANLLMAWRDRRSRAIAEATAQAERERLSDILSNMGDVVWSASLPDFTQTYISPSIATVTGYAADQLLREPELLTMITPPEDQAVRNAALERAMESGRFDVTHRLRCADGSLRWVRCKAVVTYDEAGRPHRLDGTLSDVTAEREAVERARRSDLLYRAVVDDQEEAIIRFRPDFTISFTNRQYASFYNLTPADLTGIHLGDLLAPGEWAAVKREIGQLTPLRQTVIHEYEKPLPDGTRRWLRWVNRALLDSAGRITEFQCVGHDISDLKRLERELEDGRELFALVVASSGDGIFDWNVDTGEVWYSARWKEMFGYSDDELPNTYESWEKVVHPEDRQKVLEKGAAYFRNPVGVHRIRARYLHRNGSIVHIESRVIRRQTGADGTLRVVGAYTDITTKVLAEERMRDAIESLSDGFAWFDADDRLIMHNERYLEFFPFLRRLGDLGGLPFIDMVCHPEGEMSRMPDPEAYVAARMQRHREGGTFELPLEDGGWVRVSERRTADRGTVSIWSDITELKRAQQRLLDAVAAMQEGFLLIGPDRHVILSNQRCRDMYPLVGHLLEPGAAYEAFLREGVAQGQFLEAVGRGEDYISEALALLDDEAQIRVERELAGGRWVLISQRRMSDGSVVSIRTELTQQKQRESELEAARGQLEKQASTLVDLAEKLEQARLSAVEASKAKTRFLAHMSHELRTPLNAILGFAKLIEDELFGPIGTPKYKEYVGLIQESGTHLLSLINDVLDLSKVEAGRMVLDRRWVSVEELATASTRLMEGLAKDRGVALTVEIADCRQLHGDERSIKQMIINLLSNALKFTPAGGRVALRFARHDEAARGLWGATITVADSGIGMSPDDIVKALDPFGQVDGEIARQHQGTGLGLPLVKAMAEAHGGRLEVESAPGIGTTITIHLPDPENRAPDGDVGGDGHDDDGHRGDAGPPLLPPGLSEPRVAELTPLPRVLLAEDNPMNRRLFLDVLANLPVAVDCVGDGAAAVDRVRCAKYDLILMDIQMPKMGGVDATQCIRAYGDDSARVPIVALTAHAMEGDRERYLAAGMNDYLTKPVDLTALVDMVTRYLGLTPLASASNLA